MCISNVLLNFIVASESFVVSTTPYTISEEQFCSNEGKVDLNGYLARYIGKSVSLFQPIQVYKNQDSLKINALFTLGFLDIAVYDFEGNTVYHKSMNITAKDLLTIDTSGWDSGAYKIRFINHKHEVIHGEFRLA